MSTRLQETGVEYIFCAYVVREDGTIIYPKKDKCLRIPVKK